MTEAKIKVLIVDDEPLARKFIRRMLKDDAGVIVVGECGNGRDAVTAILDEPPDLVFLDIQMPLMDGFAVIEKVGIERMPAVVFTTAYEQYAIRAFEVHALDYLLKPFDQIRFHQVMKHARERLRKTQDEDERRQVTQLLESVRERAEYLERLIIKSDARIIFLKTDEIAWIEADDKYVHLHTWKKRAYMVRQSISAMEAQLDPKKFLRIHRSVIVQLEQIKELRPLIGGEHTVVLEDGTELTLSRNYKNRLFEILGKPL
jgi:two-component system, LytTR family, response regulator